MQTPVELLAPARDLDCGIAAINHGADAVYIGGPSFGARTAAGNSLADINALARHAHRYGARVYLTLNTILFDDELEPARRLAHEAWDAGVDALIIQDLGLLELDLPPLPLFASTQMHNTTPGHVRFLEDAGISRVILARELGVEEIRDIREQTTVELEAFVHGALCVSYSGRCYLSAAMGGRSANRGECGQPCRLPWDLTDETGTVIDEGRHLLCLKDMDRSACLEALLDAGVTSFKIEGRLKDVSYVKNITARYRTRIDELLAARPEYAPASPGRTTFTFTPDPARTFCRGTTDYLPGSVDIWSPDTPKSLGETLGAVSRCGNAWFSITGAPPVHAGDGLCFFDEHRNLTGMQVMKVEGERIRTREDIPGLHPGLTIHRNRDHDFLQQLNGESASRRLGLVLKFSETAEGFRLGGATEDGVRADVLLEIAKQPATNPEAALRTLKKQLGKLGQTIFRADGIAIDASPCFLRTAEINALRRELVEALEEERLRGYQRPRRPTAPREITASPDNETDLAVNVSNEASRAFCARHGIPVDEPAFELREPRDGEVLMTTRHCIRKSLGACLKDGTRRLPEPLFIQYRDQRFRLSFDCHNCRMRVISEKRQA